MIRITNDEEKTTYEISHTGDDLNIDVINADGEVEYYFDITHEELHALLKQHQKNNGII